MATLTTETFHFGDRYPLHTNLRQRAPNIIQFEGLDNCGD
jgi:hypothetical protein